MIEAQKESRLLAWLLVSGLSIAPAIAAEQCPLDRMIFKDSQNGKEFAAERVAVKFQYLCGGRLSKVFTSPQGMTKNCHGPFGDTIVEGSLDGKHVFAVYAVTDSAPCCVWYSYLGTDRSSATSVRHWLAHGEVPRIEFGDEWYTIGTPNPPFDPDKGPLGGQKFVPAKCRPN